MHFVLALVALLITYGSVYPFAYDPDAANLEVVIAFLTHFDMRTRFGNLVANVVLFVPYAFFAVLAVEGTRYRRAYLCVYLVLGFLLAVLLQVAQLWLPGRNPAMSDAFINAIGLALGWALAVALGRVVDRAGGAGRTGTALIPVEWLSPLVLVLLWVVYRWFPLVPTIDLQNVRHALKPILLAPSIDPLRIAANAVSWLVWMWLLLRTPLARTSSAWIATAAVVIVLMQPLFASNAISVANVAGLAMALMLLPWLRHHEATWMLGVALLMVVLVQGFYPFRLADPPNPFEWLPFAGYLSGSMDGNTLNRVYKSFVYGSAIFLMRSVGMSWRRTALLLVLWLGFIEVGQIWIATRTAEITDPMLALLLIYVMSRFEREGARRGKQAGLPPRAAAA